MSIVPIIDLAPSFSGDAHACRAVAAEIGKACETVGFLMVTGHGIPQEMIDDVDRLSREFFDLPHDERLKIAMDAGTKHRGYRFVGQSTVSASIGEERPPDLREQFVIGPEPISGDPYYQRPGAERFFVANVWPEQPAGLRPVLQAYYAACGRLSTHLMRMFALALDLPESYFDDKVDRHITNFNAVHYPRQAVPPKPGQLRAGAHCDFGSLTLLATDGSPGGLQVQLDGEWHDVMPVRGAFIVNLGDLMARWTNDRWRSTMHRVVNPPQGVAATSRRLSLVFFHQPNFDAMVECLPTCLAPGETAKYPPVTSGDHLALQIQRTYGAKRVPEPTA